jgi:CheY-like chemotaxis protein
VDDEPGIRQLLEFWFGQQGIPAWSAGSGPRAVEEYRSRQDQVGLVLLNVTMPGLDGPQTLEQLRALNPQVRFAFTTGGGSYTEQELNGLGPLRILKKPFSFGELEGLLRELNLPSGPTPPAAPDRPPPPAGREQRRWPRREGNPVGVFVARPDRPGPEQAFVLDRSPGGLCLSAPAEAEPGTVLHVRPVAGAATPWVPVEVRHRRPAEGRWAVGCQFAESVRASVKMDGFG